MVHEWGFSLYISLAAHAQAFDLFYELWPIFWFVLWFFIIIFIAWLAPIANLFSYGEEELRAFLVPFLLGLDPAFDVLDGRHLCFHE